MEGELAMAEASTTRLFAIEGEVEWPDTAEGAPEGWNSDKWATPWSVIHELEAEFGKFDVDVCCERHTAKAERYYTVDNDGLTLPWIGRVWCNPPYSDPLPWCRRAHEATASGEADLVVMLLPVATDTRWFHEWVWGKAEVRFVRGRIKFIGWMGTPIGTPKSPSMLAIYRKAA